MIVSEKAERLLSRDPETWEEVWEEIHLKDVKCGDKLRVSEEGKKPLSFYMIAASDGRKYGDSWNVLILTDKHGNDVRF